MATTDTITNNKDIDYILKDFTSVSDALISFANINFGPGTSANRLWTDFNADSFSRNWLEIVAYVADTFFFYFDVQATQSYLQTATIKSAIANIAKQFGFTPASATSASGVATFTFTAAGSLPRGFRLLASNGSPFYLTNTLNAGGAGQFSGTVLQGIIKSEQFIATGLQNEEFNLAGPNVVTDLNNLNLLDISPQVTVNGNVYSLVSSLIRFNGTDAPPITDSLGNLIGGGGRVFTLDQRPTGTPFIRFGDGVFGRKLSPADTVAITYRTGGGSAGNIGIAGLTTFVDFNTVVTSVTNAAQFSGGSDEQSIEQLRELIPASLSTLDRAVAAQDYADILVANFNQVFTASAEQNTTQVGVDINVYVVPQGTGITNISDNPLLKSELTNFIDRRKMVTVQFQILDAFGISTLYTFEVHISNTASKSTVKQAIDTSLQNFFSLTTGGPNGSGISFAQPVLLKDITTLIEAVSGVERFEIKRLTYRPRVEQNVIGLVTTYDVSEIGIFPNVTEREWLIGASGTANETAGTVLFSNTGLIGFSYNSGTGLISYAFPVDLNGVSPGDLFRDGANADFTILGVNTVNSTLYLSTGLTINSTVTTANHGSIRNSATAFESFKLFKKINATATNMSVDSITDNQLDLSVLSSLNGNAIAARVLLDNTNVFIPNQYSTGKFYLVDAAGNIWEIVANDSNTLTTSITAVNDASISTVASGAYKIVTKMVGQQVVFNNSIFNIQYNNDSTLFSIAAQFNQIGTIGDKFQISQTQTAVGNLGIAATPITYNSVTKEIKLGSSPNLAGINSNSVLIDNTNQIFNIVAVDDRANPSVIFDNTHQNNSYILYGTGIGQQYAEGFKVPTTTNYAVVSLNLKRQGNIVGNLIAKIVNDSAGLPNLSSVVATSSSVNVLNVSNSAFQKVVFPFATPPSLTSGTQYHLVISGDAGYNAAQEDNVKTYDNTGLNAFTYNIVNGVITYSTSPSTPVLSSVLPGNFFRDGLGALFTVLAVDNVNSTITIASGQSVDNTVSTSNDGAIYAKDNIYIGVDDSTPPYTDGEFSRYNGTLWSNSTLGPNQFSFKTVAIFSVEGPKSIIVDSNLTPVLGSGATITSRYYDNNNEVSFAIGIASGLVTSATDVNPLGKGTVNAIPNSKVDHFIFRTSGYNDDIVNLRNNEIPQVSISDIVTNIFGGVS